MHHHRHTRRNKFYISIVNSVRSSGVCKLKTCAARWGCHHNPIRGPWQQAQPRGLLGGLGGLGGFGGLKGLGGLGGLGGIYRVGRIERAYKVYSKTSLHDLKSLVLIIFLILK